MGADLILYMTRYPENATAEEINKAIDLYVGQMTLDDLKWSFHRGDAERYLELWEEAVWDAASDAGLGDIEPDKAPDEIRLSTGRAVLTAALREAVQETWLSPGARDVQVVYLRCPCPCDVQTAYMISGGMSWGDEPTEAGPYLCLLESFDVASWVKPDLQHLADVAEES